MSVNDRYLMYVGTFTPEFEMGGGWDGAPSEGIYVFSFDSSSGAVKPLHVVPGLLSPSWLTFHPTLPVLYAAERELEVSDPSVGAISAYRIDDTTGQLTLMSRVSSRGDSPSYVSVHPSGGHAYATHFRGGQVVALPLDAEGNLSDVDASIQHVGRSVHPRQSEPHPHQIRPARHGRFVTVTDFGLDRVFVYPTRLLDGALGGSPSHVAAIPPGSGARHHARHPGGAYLFVNGEISSTLCVLRYDEDSGALEFLEELSTLPAAHGTESTSAQIVVHPSGETVYVSNRGHDSIAVFSFDAAKGRAEFLGTESSGGHVPRHFDLDPSGNFLLAANQTPGSIVRFRLGDRDHWPQPDGVAVEVPSPSCIRFRPIAPLG